ncbi:hypothetical protein [Mesorhizobium sp.]|nr:hypothetical protein [Mesorhizobium sp.]
MPIRVQSFPEIDRLRAEIVASHRRRQVVAISFLLALIVVGAAVAWSL